MDDMKREMYIRAKARITSGDNEYICLALLFELSNTYNISWVRVENGILVESDSGHLLEEFFPEFFEMFDGRYWIMEDTIDWKMSNTAHDSHGAWFHRNDRARRCRLLDFLITHR